jgi:hypothetical protein
VVTVAGPAFGSIERDRRMLPVLNLDPILRHAALIWPVAALRDESFEPHVAGGAEEIRPDLACSKSLKKMPSGRRALIFGAAPERADLVYFAFVNYATLGYGDVLPAERWRLLGPLTAMNGMLLYGWSTAVIFEVLRRTLVRTLDIRD